ncbi:putative conjugal transfer protein [Abditibacteriota bacterium]|nr:putative conjugal transfer protein [Abditibacteriota bacterium]
MALLPGGNRPRFGGTPSPTTPNHSNGNGASAGGGSSSNGSSAIQDRIASVTAPPKPEEKVAETKADGSGLASFLLTEMEMPIDTDDADFDDEMLRLSHKVHLVLVDELGGQQFNSNDRERLRPVAQQVMNDVLKDEKPLMPKRRAVLLEEVLNEVLGFGPMQYLLNDPTISEIMVNSPEDIFIERKGKICRSRRKFVDDAHVMNIVDRIVRPLGKTANARTPMVDGRLPDGSRVNIIIPPLALNGPSMSIRKFFKKKLDSEALVTFGSMTEGMRLFLEAAVKARMNIIIAGGTGSGKTTTLNITSNFIPQGERVVTIEDAAELQVYIPNIVRLESRPKNIEGEGEVTIRDLVKNALRMRPDRVIVGECRGGETLDMLQAMNTGHEGSLSTVHSNTPRDTISRLETLCLMSGLDLPIRVISKQISSAVNLIVQQSRMSDGSRKITHITEVQGMEGDTLLLQDIFLFEQKGRSSEGKVIGKHRATGFRPKCMHEIESRGYQLPRNLFQPE